MRQKQCEKYISFAPFHLDLRPLCFSIKILADERSASSYNSCSVSQQLEEPEGAALWTVAGVVSLSYIYSA